MAAVAAPLLGVEQHEMPLFHREEERHKQRLVWRVALMSLILLTMVSSLAVGWLIQRNDALRERNLAVARQLAAQAGEMLKDNPNRLDLSTLLAVESMRHTPVLEADQVLRQSLSLLPKQAGSFQFDDAVNHVLFSSDGRTVLAGSDDGTARVFDVFSGRERSRMSTEGEVVAIALSEDGSYAAYGAENDTGAVFETSTESPILQTRHGDSVLAVAFSQDDRYFATGSYDRTARVYDWRSKTELRRFAVGAAIWSVAFSPDARYFRALLSKIIGSA